MKITRDSDVVIVKDSRITVREDLSEEELLRWATPSFLTYLKKRALAVKVSKPITSSNEIKSTGPE